MTGSKKSLCWLIRVNIKDRSENPKIHESKEWKTPIDYCAYVTERGKEIKPNFHQHYCLRFRESLTGNQVTAVMNKLGYTGNKMFAKRAWDGSDLAVQYLYKEYVQMEKISGMSYVNIIGVTPMSFRPYDELWEAAVLYKKVTEQVKTKQTGMYDAVLAECKKEFNSKTPVELVVAKYFDYHKTNELRIKDERFCQVDISNLLFALDHDVYRRSLESRISDRLCQNITLGQFAKIGR